MLTQRQDFRRLDGSIDIDFYRQKGLMERRAAMTGFFSGAEFAPSAGVSQVHQYTGVLAMLGSGT